MDEKNPCKFCESLAWWKKNSTKGDDDLFESNLR